MTASEAAAQDRIAYLILPPSLDLTEAEGLCQALRDRLHEGALLLDASMVERISTPCLQVLAAAAASAMRRGAEFRLRHASTAFSAAIADLGLTAAIPFED
jgi:chemotaxis protein CheX